MYTHLTGTLNREQLTRLLAWWGLRLVRTVGTNWPLSNS